MSRRARGRGGGRTVTADATPIPSQTYATPQASASSTLAPPPTSPSPAASLSRELEQKLTVKSPTAASGSAPPPMSSKAEIKLPLRPGFGTVGKPCQVSITPESEKINIIVIVQLVRLYSEKYLAKRMVAYDGMKSIYTAGPLPFESKEFLFKVEENDSPAGSSSSSGPKRKDREFKVIIREAATSPNLFELQQFLLRKQLDAPQEAIHALDVVLRAIPSENYTVVGRSFFSTDLGEKGELGYGLEYWRGFYQCLRPTQLGLSLNIDLSARSFYEPILVTDFIQKHFNYRDLSRRLPDRDCVKVKKALKGIKVKIRGNRTYRVAGITAEPLMQLKFTLEDKKTEISVVNYYHQTYNIKLRYLSLPALQAGSDSKPVYLPMELCSTVSGQRYTKKLNERQVTALLRASCQRPRDRENNIIQMVSQTNKDNRHIGMAFGMQVREEMALVGARVLPSPWLKYHDSGSVCPQMGQWNMTNKKMDNGGKVELWAFVNFSRLPDGFNFRFCDELIKTCKSKGVEFLGDKMRENRLRWFGHVNRRPTYAPVRKGVPEMEGQRKRGRGRPKKTWKDTVRRDMEYLGVTEDIVHDRPQWRLRIHSADPT